MASDETDLDFDETPLDAAFLKASEHVRKITNKLDNDSLLQLYGLYKQSVEGKCNTARPGWLDGRGRKKWDAWSTLGDMAQDDAKQNYIDLVQNCDCNFVLDRAHKESWVAVSSLRHSLEPTLKPDEMSILEAARNDCAERITELLRNPELRSYADDDGMTALHWAADRNATKALEAAIKAGCNVNALDNSGQSPLHYAASCGHLESTKVLLDAGAEILKDNEDCTPFDVASDDEIRCLLSNANSVCMEP